MDNSNKIFLLCGFFFMLTFQISKSQPTKGVKLNKEITYKTFCDQFNIEEPYLLKPFDRDYSCIYPSSLDSCAKFIYPIHFIDEDSFDSLGRRIHYYFASQDYEAGIGGKYLEVCDCRDIYFRLNYSKYQGSVQTVLNSYITFGTVNDKKPAILKLSKINDLRFRGCQEKQIILRFPFVEDGLLEVGWYKGDNTLIEKTQIKVNP